ncbi:hypothetical protein ACFV6E_32095 [Streptomyces sp. NPDC059785]|uniref:hypothetical protein n=1 Tax=unclassified Streptomyces TaxID=2593676 RepID=UPI00365A2404
MTYRPDHGRLWRKRELFLNAHGTHRKVVADRAVSDARDTGGDALFDGVLRTLRTGPA